MLFLAAFAVIRLTASGRATMSEVKLITNADAYRLSVTKLFRDTSTDLGAMFVRGLCRDAFTGWLQLQQSDAGDGGDSCARHRLPDGDAGDPDGQSSGVELDHDR